VPQLHFCKFRPNVGQIIDCLEVHLHSLLKDGPGLREILVFVELGKINPKRGHLPGRLLWVDSHDRLGVSLHHLFRLASIQFSSFLPLVNVIRVLPQKDFVHQEWTALHEIREPCQPNIELHRVNLIRIDLHCCLLCRKV